MIETIRWVDNSIRILDQTALPEKEIYLNISSIDELLEAIVTLKVRGAPALGIAGAYGMALGISRLTKTNDTDFLNNIEGIANRLINSRPTAVNLKWGVWKIKKILELHREQPLSELKEMAITEAHLILKEDISRCMQIGKNGSDLIKQNCSILTHCNTGGLATGGFGTALGVVVTAHMEDKHIHVYVDETRPLLQGARLTSWELMRENIDHTLITDNMAGYLMAQNKVDCVIVGADRIAINGDTANKIGTYTLAVLCEKLGIPFYVAAPTSTIDATVKNGNAIPIEVRNQEEVTVIRGNRIAPLGTIAYNPAFDVTPASMITSIITERKIYKGPHYNFADLN